MFELEKSFTFEASHKLPFHDGKCAALHGHSWEVTIICRGADDQLYKEGPKQGMLVDYGTISTVIKPFIEKHLDHKHLNDSLNMESPTSELIAKCIYEYLSSRLPFVYGVRIGETCTSRCLYLGLAHSPWTSTSEAKQEVWRANCRQLFEELEKTGRNTEEFFIRYRTLKRFVLNDYSIPDEKTGEERFDHLYKGKWPEW